jgi:three-Cys-motif partner protein
MASDVQAKALEDDGLPTPEIGGWGENKYRLVSMYAALFARSMQNKWDALVYLDLFAGSGRSQIRGTRRVVLASPLLVVGMAEAFQQYIFCESNKSHVEALAKRCRRAFPDRKVTILHGDAN